MNTLKQLAAGTLALLAGTQLWAQIPGTRIPPRTDDHFQRRLVVNRIDLSEKINQPLVSSMDLSVYEAGKFHDNQGIVAALVNGLKAGKYLAYDPDNLCKTLTYEDVVALSDRCNMVDDPMEDPWIEEPDPDFPTFEIEEEIIDENNGNIDGDGLSSSQGTESEGVVIAPLESSIEFIENRIFDKNRSAEIYDIQYIRLVWVDPGETLPDKNFVCFKFSDVLATLENTQWKNRFNDAEDRNLREIFEERIFTSFVTNVSGNGVRTLSESAFRSQQMLEFEHNLWNY